MKFAREIQVGIFVIAALLVVGYLAVRVDDRPFPKSQGKVYHVYLQSATGLISKARVKLAGIQVGYIEKITLQDYKARATIVIRKDLKLTTSTSVSLKTLGILGDKFIDIVPGSPDDPILEDGAILMAREGGATLDDLPDQLGSLTTDIKQITTTVKNILRGDTDQNIPLTRIINNLVRTTEDLNLFVGRNKELMNVLIDNLVTFSENLNRLVGQIDNVEVAQLAKRIDNILVKVETIAANIESGKGTLGKLINDEETIDELNTAVRGVNSMISKSERLKTIVDFNAEYNLGQRSTKNYISLSIQPKQDSFYHFQAVVDPRGTVTTLEETTNGVTTVKRTIDKNKLKFSAQLAKRYMDFLFKVGIFENTGGISIDYLLFSDLIGFSFEAFDLGRDGNPHLKVRANAKFFKYFYAMAGGDELVGRPAGEVPAFFLGAGLNFTDDDIKSLLGVFSFM